MAERLALARVKRDSDAGNRSSDAAKHESPRVGTFSGDATAAHHKRLDGLLAAFDLQTLAGYRHFLEIEATALLPLDGA